MTTRSSGRPPTARSTVSRSRTLRCGSRARPASSDHRGTTLAKPSTGSRAMMKRTWIVAVGVFLTLPLVLSGIGPRGGGGGGRGGGGGGGGRPAGGGRPSGGSRPAGRPAAPHPTPSFGGGGQRPAQRPNVASRPSGGLGAAGGGLASRQPGGGRNPPNPGGRVANRPAPGGGINAGGG